MKGSPVLTNGFCKTVPNELKKTHIPAADVVAATVVVAAAVTGGREADVALERSAASDGGSYNI